MLNIESINEFMFASESFVANSNKPHPHVKAICELYNKHKATVENLYEVSITSTNTEDYSTVFKEVHKKTYERFEKDWEFLLNKLFGYKFDIDLSGKNINHYESPHIAYSLPAATQKEINASNVDSVEKFHKSIMKFQETFDKSVDFKAIPKEMLDNYTTCIISLPYQDFYLADKAYVNNDINTNEPEEIAAKIIYCVGLWRAYVASECASTMSIAFAERYKKRIAEMEDKELIKEGKKIITLIKDTSGYDTKSTSLIREIEDSAGMLVAAGRPDDDIQNDTNRTRIVVTILIYLIMFKVFILNRMYGLIPFTMILSGLTIRLLNFFTGKTPKKDMSGKRSDFNDSELNQTDKAGMRFVAQMGCANAFSNGMYKESKRLRYYTTQLCGFNTSGLLTKQSVRVITFIGPLLTSIFGVLGKGVLLRYKPDMDKRLIMMRTELQERAKHANTSEEKRLIITEYKAYEEQYNEIFKSTNVIGSKKLQALTDGFIEWLHGRRFAEGKNDTREAERASMYYSIINGKATIQSLKLQELANKK